MKAKRILGGITAASVLTAGLVLGGAGAASAGSQTLYSKSCGENSVATQARGQNKISFSANIPNVGARSTSKGSDGDTTLRTHYVYWTNVVGSKVTQVNSGGVSNAGTLSSASWFCDL
jgi:hypothetical protein